MTRLHFWFEVLLIHGVTSETHIKQNINMKSKIAKKTIYQNLKVRHVHCFFLNLCPYLECDASNIFNKGWDRVLRL